MMNVLAAGGVALSLVGAPLAVEPPGDEVVSPPKQKITIDIVMVNGSGCPKGTTRLAMSPDNTAMTVTYSQYLAQVGPGTRPTDRRKNCQLAVNVHVPHGFTYAIVKADYRGYGDLKPGATGVQQANYYFQGMPRTEYRAHEFRGPMDDNWQTTDQTDIAAASWAPCGDTRFLNINTELRVNAGSSDVRNATSFMSMDSTDTTISTWYQFAWMACPEEQRQA